MLLKKQIKRQKEYLSFQRRWNKLWEKMRDAPKRKLEVPYQAGWNIYMDVRDDIKNRLAVLVYNVYVSFFCCLDDYFYNK